MNRKKYYEFYPEGLGKAMSKRGMTTAELGKLLISKKKPKGYSYQAVQKWLRNCEFKKMRS